VAIKVEEQGVQWTDDELTHGGLEGHLQIQGCIERAPGIHAGSMNADDSSPIFPQNPFQTRPMQTRACPARTDPARMKKAARWTACQVDGPVY
jgi:hypothetical protein